MCGLFLSKLSLPFRTRTSSVVSGKILLNSLITGVAKMTSPKKAVCMTKIFFILQK